MKSREIEYEGLLNINGYEINCYILKDGTRVLSGRGMQEALKLVDEPTEGKQVAGTRIHRLLGQTSLEPFIYKNNTKEHFNPLICYKGKTKINGYEATVLVDICDAILEARRSGVALGKRQEIVADQCEILVRAFARVGITALVDEATGYQYQRERFELAKILEAYISDEILKWQLTFTDDFYRQIFRLWNVPFIASNIKRKPQFIGNLTNKYIYEQLPDGVLEVLRSETPKTEAGNYKHRFHQSLTADIGREHLKKQITEVTTLMEISNSKEEFQAHFKKKYKTDPQLELEMDFIKQPQHKKQQPNDMSNQQSLDFT
jgi:hypothetical protein